MLVKFDRTVNDYCMGVNITIICTSIDFVLSIPGPVYILIEGLKESVICMTHLHGTVHCVH